MKVKRIRCHENENVCFRKDSWRQVSKDEKPKKPVDELRKEQDSRKILGRLQIAWFRLHDTGGKGETTETKSDQVLPEVRDGQKYFMKRGPKETFLGDGNLCFTVIVVAFFTTTEFLNIHRMVHLNVTFIPQQTWLAGLSTRL